MHCAGNEKLTAFLEWKGAVCIVDFTVANRPAGVGRGRGVGVHLPRAWDRCSGVAVAVGVTVTVAVGVDVGVT